MPPARKQKSAAQASSTTTTSTTTTTAGAASSSGRRDSIIQGDASSDAAQQSASSSTAAPVGEGWTEPPWNGFLETTEDALLILEAARRRLIPRVTRRLAESERKLITSGSVFVFEEEESGIKRWTDGFLWSPSRILGNFLLYRETDKRHPDGTPITRPGTRPHQNAPGPTHSASSLLVLSPDSTALPPGSSTFSTSSYSRPKSQSISALSTEESSAYSASGSSGLDRATERLLLGSLTNSQKFKEDGMMKKTFSLTLPSETHHGVGKTHHLVSYYKVVDVEAGRLRTPSSLPEFKALEISPEFLDKTHFRVPPRVEVGEDGRVRFRGETATTPESPDTPLPPDLYSPNTTTANNVQLQQQQAPPNSPVAATPRHHSHHHQQPHYQPQSHHSPAPPQHHGYPQYASHPPQSTNGYSTSGSHYPSSNSSHGHSSNGHSHPSSSHHRRASTMSNAQMSSYSTTVPTAITSSAGHDLAAAARAQAESSARMAQRGAATAQAAAASMGNTVVPRGEVCYQNGGSFNGVMTSPTSYSSSLLGAMGAGSQSVSGSSASGSVGPGHAHRRQTIASSFEFTTSSTGAPPFQAPQLYNPLQPSAASNSSHFNKGVVPYPVSLAPSMRTGSVTSSVSAPSSAGSASSSSSSNSMMSAVPSLLSGTGSGSSGSSGSSTSMVSEAVTPALYGNGPMIDPMVLNKIIAAKTGTYGSSNMYSGMDFSGGNHNNVLSLVSPVEDQQQMFDTSAMGGGGSWCGKSGGSGFHHQQPGEMVYSPMQQSYGGFDSPLGVSPSHTAPISSMEGRPGTGYMSPMGQSPSHTAQVLSGGGGGGSGGSSGSYFAASGGAYNIPPPPNSSSASYQQQPQQQQQQHRHSISYQPQHQQNPMQNVMFASPTSPYGANNAQFAFPPQHQTTPTGTESSAGSSPSVDVHSAGGMAQAYWQVQGMMGGMDTMNLMGPNGRSAGADVGSPTSWMGMGMGMGLNG